MIELPLVADTPDELWRGALRAILRRGETVYPRNYLTLELRGSRLVLPVIRTTFIESRTRRLNYSFMVAEWLWMMLGFSDVASIAPYNSQIAQFSDDGVGFFGAYGPAIAKQLPAVVELLRRDPHSRQAVLTTWRPDALITATKDVPCTLTWQFFVRRARLDLHVTMRSNDAWLGFPYDLFNFTQTQRLVASALGIPTGEYHHSVGSFHLYEQHHLRANAVLERTLTADRPRVAHTLPPLPRPTWPVPGELGALLRALPTLTSSPAAVEDAVLGATEASPAWRPYAWLLLAKFKPLRGLLEHHLPNHVSLVCA